MDFARATGKLIKVLRGDLSQNELSLVLGYSYNIVHRWEKGSRKILWNEFVLLTRVKEIPLESILFELCGYVSDREFSGKKLTEFIARGPYAKNNLAQYFSIQKINRLIAGKTQLTLEDFLFMIEIIYSRVERFFSLVTKSEGINHIIDKNKTDFMVSVGRNPLLILVKLALRLQDYQNLPEHSSQCIANLTGLSVSDVDQLLMQLEQLQMIHRVGTHFQVINNFVDARSGGRESSRQIVNHWRLEIDRYSTLDKPQDLSVLMRAFLFYETNSEMDKEIFNLCNQFYVDYKNIITRHKDDKFTSLKFMHIDLFDPIKASHAK